MGLVARGGYLDRLLPGKQCVHIERHDVHILFPVLHDHAEG
jgi:hypothetical protein